LRNAHFALRGVRQVTESALLISIKSFRAVLHFCRAPNEGAFATPRAALT
jgi:hypothetical protein